MKPNKGKLAVRRSGTGLGLFALKPIPRRVRIVEYTGKIISTEQRLSIGGRYLFELDRKWAIDGRARTNLGRYVNHSCRPNAIAYLEGRRVWIWSRRAIDAGEEITINYGKEYFDEFIGSENCRCPKCTARRADTDQSTP
jgi:SET domain-containing protein